MKETLIYLNPAAGSGRCLEIWGRLLARRPELRQARLIALPDRCQALGLLRETLQMGTGFRRIFSLGGDGTLNRVANEVLGLGLGERVVLGLVPGGTGSDLARNLGLPRRPEAALERLLGAGERTIDALRLEAPDGRCRYSVNVASAGISGMVDQAVNARPRKGATVYVRATLRAALSFRSAPYRLLVDGEPWFEGEAFLVAMANSRYFGRGMKVAPRAELCDGHADVVVVGPIPRWQLPWRMGQVFLGSHLEAAPVRWCRCRELVLEALGPAPPLDLDGESFDTGSVRVSVMPSALRLLA